MPNPDKTNSTFLLIGLVVWIGLIFVGYLVGKPRGRGVAGAVLAALFGPLGILLALFLPASPESRPCGGVASRRNGRETGRRTRRFPSDGHSHARRPRDTAGGVFDAQWAVGGPRRRTTRATPAALTRGARER